MSSNFVRFQEILNQALAENFSCLTQKLANPPLKSGSSFLNRDTLLTDFHWDDAKGILVFSNSSKKRTKTIHCEVNQPNSNMLTRI